jgi:hypothetical protein
MSKPTEQPVLKDDLMGLKEKLEAIEAEFEVKLEEVERKNQKYEEVDSKLEELLSQNNSLMSLNVGGKVYQTRLSTLLSIKDTLFYYVLAKRVMSNSDIHEEIFVDRNFTNFDFFLDYLRTQKFSLAGFVKSQVDELGIDADYYGFTEILNQILDVQKEVDFIGMEGTSAKYSTAGTHNFKDLKTTDLNTGVCVQSPYTIIIEFNFEHEFDKIDVGGYNGNTSVWGVTNGANSKIYTSKDKVTWTEIGTIPHDFGNKISNLSVKKTIAKYIKFQHTSYVGLGHLKIIKTK